MIWDSSVIGVTSLWGLYHTCVLAFGLSWPLIHSHDFVIGVFTFASVSTAIAYLAKKILEHAERRVFFIKKAQEAQVQATAKNPAGAKMKTKKTEKEEMEKKKKAFGNYTRRELGPTSGGRA